MFEDGIYTLIEELGTEMVKLRYKYPSLCESTVWLGWYLRAPQERLRMDFVDFDGDTNLIASWDLEEEFDDGDWHNVVYKFNSQKELEWVCVDGKKIKSRSRKTNENTRRH